MESLINKNLIWNKNEKLKIWKLGSISITKYIFKRIKAISSFLIMRETNCRFKYCFMILMNLEKKLI